MVGATDQYGYGELLARMRSRTAGGDSPSWWTRVKHLPASRPLAGSPWTDKVPGLATCKSAFLLHSTTSSRRANIYQRNRDTRSPNHKHDDDEPANEETQELKKD